MSQPMTMSQSVVSPRVASAELDSPTLDRAPFRWTQRDQHTLPVTTEGTLPSWLHGDLVRTAPAVFDVGDWHAAHWFDGMGLIYGFGFEHGKASFKQSLLDTRIMRTLRAGKDVTACFGTSTQRSLLSRVFKPVPPMTDNTNVNIVPWQGSWLALTETPYQHVIDPNTLQTRGLKVYDDALSNDLAMLAHPHYDFARDAMVNIATKYGPTTELMVIRQGARDTKRTLEAKLPFKRAPYIHDFGCSERSVVIIDHPLRVSALSLLFTNRPLIESHKWEPQTGTKLWKLDRASGKWTSYETEALFCFHVVNTFEDGADTVFDFCAYDDASIISSVSTDNLRRHLPTLMPRYLRARLSPGKKRVELEQLSSEGFEFPSIAYRAQHGRAYHVAWGAKVYERNGLQSSVVRVDHKRAEVRSFSSHEIAYGEPIFVPKPGAKSLTEGVILSVGSYMNQDRAQLAVLDADSLDVVAQCEVPLALPLGFHGNFKAR